MGEATAPPTLRLPAQLQPGYSASWQTSAVPEQGQAFPARLLVRIQRPLQTQRK
ncbi:hypothetical protein H4S00_001509, partial [Coemansia sp. D1744]